MAEGVFGEIAAQAGLSGMIVDSAGTSDWHVGSPPDERAVKAAAGRGIDISSLRARQFVVGDFERFDVVAAMDAANLAKLRSWAPSEHYGKIRLFLDFARDFPVREIPDPYYGGPDEFETVLDLLDTASRGLADHIARSKS